MKKVKIIRLPSFFKKRHFSSKMNSCLIPSLGPGLIVSYLRSKGIPVEQDDLNIKIHFDNHYSNVSEDKIDTEIFFDAARIGRYGSDGQDSYIDSVMERVEKKTKIYKDQITLLSLPDNIENESNLAFALAFSSYIKKKYNSVNILGGDMTWSNLLRTKYDCRDVDFILQGDGEYVVHGLLNSMLNGHKILPSRDLSIFEGGRRMLSYRVSEPLKPDFSGLPMENYRSREELLDYPQEIEGVMKKFMSSGALILPYRFIRGCPFKCIFCISSTQDLTHALPPKEVVNHLESLQGDYSPTGFFFLNDTINISNKYINELCDEIIARRLKILWSDCARVNNLDKDTLFKMRKAGCVRLIFGMETASPRLLRYVNKEIDLKKLEDVLCWSDEAGIWTGIEIICGFPHENKEDVEATISFLNKNKKYINRIYLNLFDLRQNTLLYNSPKKYGLDRIFEVNQYAEKDFSSYVKFGFDETGGLSWKDKQKQIEDSVRMVRESCVDDYRFFTDEHLLFFLYSNLMDKDTINSIYHKILKQ